MTNARFVFWQLCMFVLLLIFMCRIADADESSLRFPIYPGAKRIVLPGSENVAKQNSTMGMFDCKTTPQKLFEWYTAKLGESPWTTDRIFEPDGDNNRWSIKAKHEEGIEATVNGFSEGSPGNTRLVVMLRGEDISDEIFGGVRPVIGTETVSTGGEPNLQAGIASLQKVVEALSAWCENPTDANAKIALAAGNSHRNLSKAMRSVVRDVKSGPGESLSAQLFLLSARSDIEIGLALMAVESIRKHPGDIKKLRAGICPILKRLRDDQIPGMQTIAKYAEATLVTVKKGPDEQGHDLPITEKLFTESLEPRFVPSTTLTVTRFWTPGQEYWNEILRRTFAALKSWKAGCPDQCDYINDVYHCKVWGEGEEARKHCNLVGGWAGLEAREENQKAVMSDPCTLFGLAATTVEVGDPKQLEQGGEIVVFVDGDELMRCPLKPLKKPYYASYTRDEGMNRARELGQQAPAEIWDKMLTMMQYAYGEEAARHFQLSQRADPLVAERGGGEFNGYTDFVPVGSMPVAGFGGAMVIAPVPPAVGLPSCYKRAQEIVRKHHPALKHEFLIELQATVGGIPSQRVALKVPAVLSNPSGVAGEWDGNWPGGTPETDWRFGQQLGAQPAPECPDRLDVSDKKAKLMADATKLARAYELLIMKKWIERLRSILASKMGEKLGADLREATGLPAVPEVSKELVTGGKVMENAISELGGWMEKKLIGSTLSDLRKGNLESLISSVSEEALGKGMCDNLFSKAEHWRGAYQLINEDLTRKALTPYGLKGVHYHRFQICNTGEAYLQIGDTLSSGDQFGELGNKIGGTYIAQKLGKKWSLLVQAAYYGATAGWAIADLYAIVQIEQELDALSKLLDDPRSWTSP